MGNDIFGGRMRRQLRNSKRRSYPTRILARSSGVAGRQARRKGAPAPPSAAASAESPRRGSPRPSPPDRPPSWPRRGSSCGRRPALPASSAAAPTDRFARPGGIVLGRPPGQIDHVGGNEGFGVEDLADRLTSLPAAAPGPASATTIPVTTRPPRGTTTRAPTGGRNPSGTAYVRKSQPRNGDGDSMSTEPAASPAAFRRSRTFFMSSHTSRFDDGLRSR